MSKETLLKKAESIPYIPTGRSTIQALISSIPFVGSALDHLLFDKADEIRLKNIERTVDDIAVKVKVVDEAKISKEWFGSEECIQMFRLLTEKTQFEPDGNKAKNLAEIFVKSGFKEFESDPNKFAVMMRASEMTFVQQNLLQVICGIFPERKTPPSNGNVKYTATLIWEPQIRNALLKVTQFWVGELNLSVELEILESFNLIYRSPLSSRESGYYVMALGRLIADYLSDQ